MFNVNELSQDNKQSRLALHHNNQAIVQLYADDGQGWVAASNTAIISLNKGDTVMVKAGRTETAYLHGHGIDGHPYIYCTFNGVLLTTK